MERKSSIFICILFVLSMGCANPDASDQRSSGGAHADMEELLVQMTLKEKVGQMTQLTLDMLLIGQPYAAVEPHTLDSSKMQEVLVDYRVGSILNCGGHGYDREFWLETISAIQEKTKETPLQIPVLYGIDAIHGPNYTNNASLFPQQIGLSCTWDTTMARELAAMSAYETRASGIRWNFSPVLDIARDPRWPRFWETFGEDVKLVSDMGVKTVEGLQGAAIGEEHVAACLKHFLGYSQTLTGKDRTAAWIPERQLREYFLPSFEAAIDAGAMTIMVNSGEMNGIPVHINPVILTDLLRNELGFEGMVVTDWEDIKYLVTRHKVAADYKSAIEMVINAGIDMSMVPTDLEFPVLLEELVNEGRVPMSRIDESVMRILILKKKLGLFDTETPKMEDYPDFASDQFRYNCLKAARRSIVMLKNEGETLPMSTDQRILVVGDNAKSLNDLNGGWTHTWQGVDTTWNTPGMPSIWQALQSKCSNIDFIDEESFLNGPSRAEGYERVIAVIGEHPYTETVGDIEDLQLREDHRQVMEALGNVNTPSTIVLVEGRPRTFGEVPEGVDAMLLAMLPGDQGGNAIADILTGEYNPSGHLSFTYPRYPSAHTPYDHKYTDMIAPDFSMNAVNPLFEFGEGMSYTTFEYSDLSLGADSVSVDGTLEVNVKVTNSGALAGEDVVQVYVADSVATITPSKKRLRAYRRIALDAGQSMDVSFSIPVSEMRFVGTDNKWIIEPGKMGVEIDELTASFVIK